MLRTIGAASLDALMDEAIPASIRLPQPLDLPRGKPEYQYLRDLRSIAARNRLFKSYIGLGYYDCVTPSVILRNVLENPGWYTPVYAVPGRNRAGTPRRTAELPDDGPRSDRDADRQRIAARRGHRRRRSDDDAPPGSKPADRQRPAARAVSGVRGLLSADDRRPARARRTARDRADRRATSPGASSTIASTACCCRRRTKKASCTTTAR